MAYAAVLSADLQSDASSAFSFTSCRKVNKSLTTASSGEIRPVWNAVAFRRSFPASWAAYLRETYRTAYAVEKAFGIDSKTARDWIGGKRDPSGSFVAAAVAQDPNALKILMGAA